MNGYLLDTHVALRGVHESARLPHSIRKALETGPNIISVTSYWEVMLKSMKGNLDVGDPRIWWAETLDALNAEPLSVLPAHINGLHGLPPIHADPFDRILVAQAITEDLALLTTDSQIVRYGPGRLTVIAY